MDSIGTPAFSRSLILLRKGLEEGRRSY